MSKVMDHNEYPKSLIDKPEASLRYIMKDAHSAMMAMPDGENVGYYADEVCYCSDELARRTKANVLTTMNRLIVHHDLKIKLFKAGDPRLTLPLVRAISDRCIDVLFPSHDEIEDILKKMEQL